MLSRCLLAAVVLLTSTMSNAHESRLDETIETAMASTGAEGLAVAVVRGGEVTHISAHGVRNAQRDPLTQQSVMYGASLTKTVFAYFVLQLVDDGMLELDQTIGTLLPRPLPEYEGFGSTHAPWPDLARDPRWKTITPRMLLTHSSGFRNFHFVTPDGRLDFENGTLDIHFDPGTRYLYSGDGFILLQFVLEQGLGLDVRKEMENRVFAPLGMTSTDMMWRDEFSENLADGFTAAGDPVPHDDRSKVRAAGSMDTTIADMARFAQALATCRGLSKRACVELFRPSIEIAMPTQFYALDAAPPEGSAYPGLAAGLGLITTQGPQGRVVFKGGHNDSTGNMMVCLPDAGDCVVLLANDVRAEAGFPMLVEAALGETGVPWRWEYPNLEIIDHRRSGD